MFSKIGEVSALVTAFSWTAAAMIFETASRRSGVTAVNTFKVFFGTLYLAFLALILNNNFFPTDLTFKSWVFMSVSGIVGFVIGDYFLFNSYLMVGSRIGMLLLSASVPMTAIASYFIFGESISIIGLTGITVAILGIGITVIYGGKKSEVDKNHNKNQYVKGIIFGMISAFSMAIGTLLTKVGAEGVSAVSATQVRIFSALIGFIIYVFIFRKSHEVIKTLKEPYSLSIIAIGSVFGPFIGVGALLFALQHTSAGIVATISSLTPVFIILPSIIFFKKRVSFPEIAGTFIAVSGISLLFI